MNFRSVHLLSYLIAALGVVACADLQRGERWEDSDAGGGSATASSTDDLGFTSDVHPLLLASCAQCHAPGASAGDTGLVLVGDGAIDYVSVLESVVIDAPSASPLLAKAAGSGHVAGVVFAASSAEYQLLYAWIQEGAKP